MCSKNLLMQHASDELQICPEAHVAEDLLQLLYADNSSLLFELRSGEQGSVLKCPDDVYLEA